MKAKFIKHNDNVQLDYGHHGYSDTREHLIEGQIYDVTVDEHDWHTNYWHTNYCIDGRAYNSVCFEAVDGEDFDDINDANGLPKKLKVIVADTPNAFVCRIGTEPRTRDTGIANIIPQGIDRDARDKAIAIANRIVFCWNNTKT